MNVTRKAPLHGARGVPDRPGIRRGQFADEADAVAVAQGLAGARRWWTCSHRLDGVGQRRAERARDHGLRPSGRALLNKRAAEPPARVPGVLREIGMVDPAARHRRGVLRGGRHAGGAARGDPRTSKSEEGDPGRLAIFIYEVE